MTMTHTIRRGRLSALVLGLMVAAAIGAGAQGPATFATPQDAVEALRKAARADDIAPLLTLLGEGGRELAASSDAATARQNRDVFLVAMREGWQLVDVGTDRKELVVGKEAWPFPVPIVKTPGGWVFDAAAGKEEVLTRRIGRNEIAAMRILGTYVTAQRVYARSPHDGVPAGAYARRFGSAPGTQDGLYWPVTPGQASSPLGPLVAQAAAEGRPLGAGSGGPTPFHGYYFRILERQGGAAKGGARSWVTNGVMTGGFGLVAWPAEYGATGITTFMVGPDGVVYERDLGPGTAAAVAKITAFNPDKTWQRAAPPTVP